MPFFLAALLSRATGSRSRKWWGQNPALVWFVLYQGYHKATSGGGGSNCSSEEKDTEEEELWFWITTDIFHMLCVLNISERTTLAFQIQDWEWIQLVQRAWVWSQEGKLEVILGNREMMENKTKCKKKNKVMDKKDGWWRQGTQNESFVLQSSILCCWIFSRLWVGFGCQ